MLIWMVPETVAALQDLLGAWNESTKDVASCLPGWISFNTANTTVDPCYVDYWRGVFCYIARNRTAGPTPPVYDARVVSITLTGNPELSGPLPPLPAWLLNNVNQTGWSLRSLDLHGNAFSGGLPDSVFDYYTRIDDLDLSNNRLEGPLPASLGRNWNLRTLKLSNNTLTGNISGTMTSRWSDLVTADFSNNHFIGSIPNFKFAKSLQTLNVSHNNLDGQVGLDFLSPQANKSLAILDLSDNKFTGPMPDLGHWNKLQSLDLSYNTFDARPFPPSLSSLTSLQTLGLSKTSLIGELDPSMLCNFTELRTVELDDNSINGTLDIDSLFRLCNGSLRTVNLRNNQIRNVKFSASSVLNLRISFKLTGNPYCLSKATDIDIQRCLCEKGCSDTKFAEYKMKPTLFAYSELEKATRNFHRDMKLGEGAFGVVYKAWKLNEEDRLMDLVDPTLSIQLDEEIVVQRVVITALACLQTTAERRPSMAQVVGMLLGDIEIGESVRGQINENVNQTYHTLLGLNNIVDEENPSLVPVDEESQALHLGESSSYGSCGLRAVELSALRSR